MRRSKRKAIQNTAAVTISDLPNHITCDILSRLSLNSIFACKRVCKLWRDLTLEPYFAKLHLSRSPLSLISYRRGNDIDNSPSYFEILQLYDPLVLRRRDATMKFRTDIYFPRIHMAASCNGSILLSNSSYDDLVVCNPLRAQQLILPKPPKLALQTHKVAQLGFGHSPSTDQYKVLRFTSNNVFRPCRLNCEIFTIGIDDEWRSMGDTGQLPALIISKIIFLNGALYWIGLENLRFICYFDIEREHFRSFPLPSHIGKYPVCLEVVDNGLYLHNWHSSHVWRFWAMKDYGDFGSWTLEWVIEEPIIYKFKGLVRPLKMLKDGSLLMTFYGFTDATKTIIASYNPRTRVLKKNKYHLSGRWCTAVADIPCFFSLMDALK
ncbi:F-box/kelch-repeat protein At3g17530-like isoform X1 [Rhododendron vialii]|uniref:F-box/kelch-repeat protein At3g17530-like isoform X1 n=1 Tax=Rhododendron vialii TaxID=182163 RepID=UPI00265FF303|nr:F-box/kelch-repeat protein At3g17530-like isoform X1 [Rhododendron vialii]XP_058210504.1 F-box/kelch-repeat protein At3g17530-like isoform X1 [Rhododendron vialii]XP_058210505.1 F-box/kelch-repeat protein At3g17530-like isoform X1 [Rhododendron vialii]XP_058210506.1 F-box/kelch-repeat protein At3g17530-like isoform X1 [Rhododendron vialii]